MLQNGSIVKLWEFEDKGKYSVVSLSQSQKDKQTGNYVTKFSSKFVRFIGAAHDKLKQCSKGERVKIVNFGVEHRYDKEKNTTFTNFIVTDIEALETKQPANQTPANEIEDDPF